MEVIIIKGSIKEMADLKFKFYALRSVWANTICFSTSALPFAYKHTYSSAKINNFIWYLSDVDKNLGNLLV